MLARPAKVPLRTSIPGPAISAPAAIRPPGLLTGLRPAASSRLLPRAGVREGEGGEAGGFGGGDAEQAQLGLGELVDGGLRDAFRVPLAHPQQPEHAAGRGAERDLGIGNGEPARGLPGLDVAQGARRQAGGDVQDIQAGRR